MQGLSKLWRYLVLDPIEKRSLNLFCFRLTTFLHERTSGRTDRYFLQLMSLLRPARTMAPSRVCRATEMAATLTHLNERGWAILPWRLSADEIAEIKRFAFSTPAYASDPRQSIAVQEAAIPREHPRYHWRMSDLVRLPAVQQVVANSAYHAIAQRYLGCLPRLTSVTLWLDPAFDGIYDAHVYHYDNDGPKFLKFFFYLNDLDAVSGAHSFIERSHSHIKPRQFAASRRYDRDDLLGHYGARSEITFAAPAGTILAEDTAGFHKGTTPRDGYRLLMQMQFAAFDIPHIEEFTVHLNRAHIGDLDSELRRITKKFFQ